jgi:hypothetical protein
LNSQKNFFGWWKEWTFALERFDIVLEFLWISPKAAKIKKHVESHQWPAHVERYVPINHVSKSIWDWYDELKETDK